jgi:hypothetical protein
VQRLVDAAVMIVAMIVPPLRSQLFAKVLNHFSPPKGMLGTWLPRFDVRCVTIS